ncbi:MAG: hypothetical protein QM820_45410 [Minicystis sp.]
MTAAAMGCGSGSDTAGTGGTGGHGGSTSSSSSSVASSSSSSSTGGDAPVRATGPICPPEAKGKVLAVNKLYFGEGNSGQWKKFGFNLDGLESTGISKDVCKPNSNGMPSTAYPDGDNGIDNSFGKNLLPTILGLYPTWTTDINNSITNGVFTALFQMSCLPATGDVLNLHTKLFGGTKLGKAPKFDGTDKWPVEPELLSDPMDPQSSSIVFKKSSVKGNAYDSGNDVQVILTVPISTQTQTTSIKLTLYAARVLMTLDDDRKGATSGMIGGVLNTEEFVTEVKKVGALLGICQSSLFASLVDQVRQASDIMTDGSQDPNKTCDGISMGLGFDMKEAQIGSVGPSIPPGNTCP